MDLLYTQNTNVIGHNVRPTPPLDHITSKIARTRAKFANFVAPALNKFPWKFSNETVADRLRSVLKLIVEGKEIEEWLTIIKNTVGTSDVIETRMAGSTSVATVYLPYLNYVTEKSELEDREELKKEFKKKEFHTSDVDMKIRVKSGASLNKLLNHKEWRVKYSSQNVILLAIGEGKKQRLDVVVFKTLEADFAFHGDDLTISLDATDLKTNTVIVSSKYPWEWLRAQAFGLIGNGGRRVHELFPRLLGKLLKGEVCTDNMEVELFHCWVNAYYNFKAEKKPDPLNFILNKQWEDHESGVVLSRYLLALRLQQLILTHTKDPVMLREAVNVNLKGDIPLWLNSIFKAMKVHGANIQSIHNIIERLGYIALCEGWEDNPFTAKVVWHGGEQVMRLRFRGDFGKKDLLFKFNPKDSLNPIVGVDPEIIRGIVRSLSFEGIHCREMTEEYKKSLLSAGLNPDAAKKLRKSLLCSNGKIQFGGKKSIVALEIDESDDPKQLIAAGNFVFDNYKHDPIKRLKLCWKVVRKSLIHAADLVEKLRKAGEVPPEGYATLFNDVLNARSDISICKACNPFPDIGDDNWLLLVQEKGSKRKLLAKLIDTANVLGETFLQIFSFDDIQDQSLNEDMLYKIVQAKPKTAPLWIQKMDRPEFITPQYKQAISNIIIDMPHAFKLEWLLAYFRSERFVAKKHHEDQMCAVFLSKNIGVLNKAKFLELLQIQEPTLWHTVANECISRGEVLPPIFKTIKDVDSQTIVTCYEIIESTEPSEVLLKKLKKIKLNDTLRESVLVRLIKNWDKKKVDIHLLEFFNSQIKWKEIFEKAQSAKSILREIRHCPFSLYSSLFRAISPPDECYQRWWVEKALKEDLLLENLEHSLYKECLCLVKGKEEPVLEKMLTTKRGIELVLEIKESVSSNLLYKLTLQAMKIEDGSETAAKVFGKFKNYKRDEKNIKLLTELAITTLMHPKGNIDLVIAIGEFLKKNPIGDCIIDSNAISKLIKSGHLDWIHEVIEKVKLTPEVFLEVLNATKDLEKRAQTIQKCMLVSEDIQLHWMTLVNNTKLSPPLWGRVLVHGEKLWKNVDVSKINIARCAIVNLPKYAKIPGKLDKDVQNYFIQLLSGSYKNYRMELWEALYNSNKMPLQQLWDSGFNLLHECDLHSSNLVHWIVENCKGKDMAKLMEFIQELGPSALEVDHFKNWIKELVVKGDPLTNKFIKTDPHMHYPFTRMAKETCPDVAAKALLWVNDVYMNSPISRFFTNMGSFSIFYFLYVRGVAGLNYPMAVVIFMLLFGFGNFIYLLKQGTQN